MNKRLVLAVLAYLVPTFALGFVWHLILFEHYYEARFAMRLELRADTLRRPEPVCSVI
jgi:hypothetical protein